jgi:hypothetical protein
MSNINAYAKTTGVGRAGQGTLAGVASTLEGGLITADLSYLLSLNGDIYVANNATATTPATFAGAYDADGPDLVIDVPLNTTIVPLYIHVQYEAVGTTLLLETFASISNSLAGTTTVTGGGTVTPVNIRTGDSGTSSCAVSYSVDAAGCTAQTGNIYELRMGGFELAEAMAATEPGWPERNWKWSAKQYGVYPIIDGEGSLFMHCASQAGTGFITVVYYEVDTANI